MNDDRFGASPDDRATSAPGTGTAVRREAPLLVAQGQSDETVLPRVQAEWVAGRCAAGQSLLFRTYTGRDHAGVVGEDSPLIPDLLSWTQDRFAGKPQAAGCQSLAG
jgi:hypothetical protein